MSQCVRHRGVRLPTKFFSEQDSAEYYSSVGWTPQSQAPPWAGDRGVRLHIGQNRTPQTSQWAEQNTAVSEFTVDRTPQSQIPLCTVQCTHCRVRPHCGQNIELEFVSFVYPRNRYWRPRSSASGVCSYSIHVQPLNDHHPSAYRGTSCLTSVVSVSNIRNTVVT